MCKTCRDTSKRYYRQTCIMFHLICRHVSKWSNILTYHTGWQIIIFYRLAFLSCWTLYLYGCYLHGQSTMTKEPMFFYFLSHSFSFHLLLTVLVMAVCLSWTEFYVSAPDIILLHTHIFKHAERCTNPLILWLKCVMHFLGIPVSRFWYPP